MAEEVHVHQTPPAGGDGSGGAGWMVAVLVIIVLAGVLFFAFGRGDRTVVPDTIEADIDVNLPDRPDPTPNPGGSP
jgi:hypothetical protein